MSRFCYSLKRFLIDIVPWLTLPVWMVDFRKEAAVSLGMSRNASQGVLNHCMGLPESRLGSPSRLSRAFSKNEARLACNAPKGNRMMVVGVTRAQGVQLRPGSFRRSAYPHLKQTP